MYIKRTRKVAGSDSTMAIAFCNVASLQYFFVDVLSGLSERLERIGLSFLASAKFISLFLGFFLLLLPTNYLNAG